MINVFSLHHHFFFSSRRRHTRWPRDWSSDVCSSDLTAQAIMARHSLDAVPRLKIVRDAIPDELEVVIERALEKVPADRYQTSGEFAKALTAASTGTVSRVTAARRPTFAQITWRRRTS